MIVRYRRIGFAVSALLHLGLVLVLVSSGATTVESRPAERALPLTLAMFEASPSDDSDKPPKPIAASPMPETLSTAENEIEPLPAEAVPAVPEEVATEERIAEPLVAEPRKPVRVPPPRAKPKPPPVARRVVTRAPSRPEVHAKPPRPEHSVRTAPARDTSPQVVSRAPPIVPNPGAAVSDLVDNAKLRKRYLDKLVAEISRRKYYPRRSRRRGEEGTVVVRFEIGREGHLRNVAIARSSGIERLDRAALKTLRKIAKVDPIPAILGQDRWPISVPIAFSLKR